MAIKRKSSTLVESPAKRVKTTVVTRSTATPSRRRTRAKSRSASPDPLNLSRTRSGKVRAIAVKAAPDRNLDSDSEDIPSPTKQKSRATAIKAAPDGNLNSDSEDIPTPTKQKFRATAIKAAPDGNVDSDSEDIPTPNKQTFRVTRSSPVKLPHLVLSPVKRRKPKNPSPDPDSESELDSSASSHRASSSVREEETSPPTSAESIPLHDICDLPSCLNAQRRQILRAVLDPPELTDQDEDSANQTALKQLSDLLEGTVERGEGNSCLLIGPRGSGKSRIVDQCLSDLSERPIILRLCGWSQQTDRLAMREIAYQLNQQTGRSFLEEEDEAEATEESEPTQVTAALPPATHLPALISLIPTLSRPTVVILDSFDLFALHPRQSLLYCLLDTVQSCRAGTAEKGLAVIGTTTRIDTLNLLEKRVKSRFSGRMFSTAPPSQPQDWADLARGILNSRIKSEDGADWQQRWEAGVQAFLEDKTTLSILNETFSVSRDVRVLARLLTSVALQLSPSSPFPTSKQLMAAVRDQRSRPRFPMLHALPYPSACLLVACIHSETAGHPTFTFEMLFERVRDQIRVSSSAPVEFRGRSIGMPQCPRLVLMSAFEHLVFARIFTPVAAPSVNVAKEFVKFRAVVSREDVKRAIKERSDTNLEQWLKKAQ